VSISISIAPDGGFFRKSMCVQTIPAHIPHGMPLQRDSPRRSRYRKRGGITDGRGAPPFRISSTAELRTACSINTSADLRPMLATELSFYGWGPLREHHLQQLKFGAFEESRSRSSKKPQSLWRNPLLTRVNTLTNLLVPNVLMRGLMQITIKK